MTDHLHALAMRTKAAETVKHWHDNRYGKHSHAAQPLLNVHAAILALPLEADHAALLAEAVKLLEIAALIRDVAKGPMLGSLMTSWINDMMNQAKALETP